MHAAEMFFLITILKAGSHLREVNVRSLPHLSAQAQESFSQCCSAFSGDTAHRSTDRSKPVMSTIKTWGQILYQNAKWVSFNVSVMWSKHLGMAARKTNNDLLCLKSRGQ